MSDKAKIEWTDASWNPVTGCAKVSQGCKNCYALRDWNRLSANPKSVYFGRNFTDVQCHPERLNQPLSWVKPRKVFVNSMSDLFHESVPDSFIDKVFAVMALSPHHIFQILTKRPERMLSYLTAKDRLERIGNCNEGFADVEYLFDHWPLKNVWLGVSIEDQLHADERIPLLLQSPAAVRWISAEPLLGSVDIVPYLGGRAIKCGCGFRHDEHYLMGATPEKECCLICCKRTTSYPTLDWVVCGGESGPDARPMHPHWVRRLRDDCQFNDTPFLFKQWGEWVPRSACYHTFEDGQACVDIDPGASKWPCYSLTEQGHDGWDLSHSDEGDSVYMQRVGKKMAGRLLEGRLHDGYPY